MVLEEQKKGLYWGCLCDEKIQNASVIKSAEEHETKNNSKSTEGNLKRYAEIENYRN